MAFQTTCFTYLNTEVQTHSQCRLALASFFPFFPGLEDYSLGCERADLDVCWQHAHAKPESNIQEFMTLAEILMNEEGLEAPTNAEEALQIYFDLLNLLD